MKSKSINVLFVMDVMVKEPSHSALSDFYTAPDKLIEGPYAKTRQVELL